jgi:hypothetical protein
MKYKIVYATKFQELELLINKMIKDGWVLQGGVGADDAFVFQAMVKHGLV